MSSIERKLMLVPALAAACVFLVSGLCFLAQYQESRLADEALRLEARSSNVQAAAADLAGAHAMISRAVAWLNAKVDVERVDAGVLGGTKLARRTIARMTKLTGTDDPALRAVQAYAQNLQQLTAMTHIEPFMSAMLLNEADARFEEAKWHLNALALAANDEASSRRIVARRVRTWVWAICIVGIVGILAGAVLCAARIGRAIARPLNDIVTTTVALAGGELDRPIPGLGRADEVGSMAMALEVFRDTARQLNERAYFDRLTGLPNRANFQRALDRALSASAHHRTRGAMLLIDLDRFKEVNDTLGHQAGDALLCEVARQLSASVRSEDLVARLGGDEFAVLTTTIEGDMPAALARRLIAAASAPLEIEGEEVHVGASIGIAIFPDHGSTAEQVLKNADIALYRAKESRGSFSFFDTTFNTAMLRRRTIEADLRRAIAEGSLDVAYQPKYRLQDGRLVSVEALVRWPKAADAVSPGEFIPIAEATGLIHDLGLFVLREACRQIAEWRTSMIEVPSLSVNVSVCQLRRTGFADMVGEILGERGLRPSSVLLELTESVFLEPDHQATRENIERLQELGFGLSLDDFGTGFSSMSYLSHLPFVELKIDQSFVRDLATSQESRWIVQGLIRLGHALRMRVVAEGIETMTQLNTLRALGCDVGQGFLLGLPGPAALVVDAPQRSPAIVGSPRVVAQGGGIALATA